MYNNNLGEGNKRNAKEREKREIIYVKSLDRRSLQDEPSRFNSLLFLETLQNRIDVIECIVNLLSDFGT